MQKRSCALSLGAAAALSAGVFAIAGPALAAPADFGPCAGGITCVYDGGYTSQLGTRSPGSPLQDITVANRNKLSSWINNSGTGARFYYNTGGRGTCVPMYAEDHASAAGSTTNPDNNQAESHAYTRIC